MTKWQERMKRERIDFWAQMIIGVLVTALAMSPGILHLGGIDPSIIYEYDFGIKALLR
ncbi:MAG: hypothetical protein WD509_01755 [Candidatus Paceibacterota bacterium]